MSKKKKNKFTVSAVNFDDLFSMTAQAKEGDLRFHQKIYEEYKLPNWYSVFPEWVTVKETKKVLQRYDGKEWRDIPFEKEFIEL